MILCKNNRKQRESRATNGNCVGLFSRNKKIQPTVVLFTVVHSPVLEERGQLVEIKELKEITHDAKCALNVIPREMQSALRELHSIVFLFSFLELLNFIRGFLISTLRHLKSLVFFSFYLE